MYLIHNLNIYLKQKRGGQEKIFQKITLIAEKKLSKVTEQHVKYISRVFVN